MKPSCTVLLFLLAVVGATAVAQERCAPPDDPILAPSYYENLNGSAAPLAKYAVAGAWSMGAKLPVAKQYHTVASYNGEIYIFAGVTSGNYYNNLSYKYSPATDSWTAIAAFPVSRFLFGQAQTVNGKIYIMAGLDNLGTSYKTVPDVWEYDPERNTYTKKRDMPLPQGFCASGVLNGKIYTIAGVGATNDAYHKLVQVYDPATDTWSRATDYPRNVKYLSSAVVDDRIIVTGGYNNTYPNMTYIADTYIGTLDADTLQWRKVSDYPIGPTIYMSGVGIDGKGWFFGGRPSIDNNAPATTRSFKYNPTLDQWTTLEPKVKGIQAMIQAGTDGKKAYLPGGQTFTGYATDTLEIFDTGAQGTPLLALPRTSVDRWVQKSQPVSERLTIKNNGYADLTWTLAVASGGNGWLSLSAQSGTIPPMGETRIELQIDATSLDEGDHAAALALACNDPLHATTTIPVTIHVQEQPVDEEQQVLIEEFSGTWCGWCPYGADTLKALLDEFPGRVHGVTYHQGANDPLVTPGGNGIIRLLGVTSYPSAAINRVPDPSTGRLPMTRTLWRKAVTALLEERRSPVRIEFFDKIHNPVTHLTRVKVRVTLHQGITGDLRLNIVQTQSGLNVGQSYYYVDSSGSTKSKILYPYYHAHAVRLVLPDSAGDLLAGPGPHASQSVFEREYWFTSLDSIPDEAELIAFVHRMSGAVPGEILQAHGERLRENSTVEVREEGVPAGMFLEPNSPNPFTGGTMIRFGLSTGGRVRLTVVDVLGRVCAVLADGWLPAGMHYALFEPSSLPAGIYFPVLQAGDKVRTGEKMLLVR
ncbi:MAG: hypothetical protein QHI48_08250 [Bacteroidota bacterium]|nr:hypothetical protein [Bacteroidota bacterium]